MIELNTVLAGFYERDLRKLTEEINLFQKEEDLWKTAGAVKNSAGNLALHIIGGLNFLIGTNLANTGYVRDRDLEFTQKAVPRKDLVTNLEALISLMNRTLNSFSPGQMSAEYPMVFDGDKRTNSYLLVQLLAHLNYHTGQVNYLRRILEP
jgi:hypothetical protein